jgi:2-polyprenyl-3-methyl-5-hydroxy-6-metoxy-1,4-benzoquinol methylase
VQNLETPYTSAYFDSHVAGSLRSAHAVLPLVLDLVDVKSAVDVGCGVGAWLSVLKELGVDDVLGIDGDYVEPKDLLIPKRCFTAHDLTQDFDVERTFDLALSLEVAEHLPPERAHSFVETLARLARVVLFSAAIPGQGGIAHVTERWPDYWAGLFAEHGYVPVDALRYRI